MATGNNIRSVSDDDRMIRDISDYTANYLGNYDFERVMVHYRRKLVVERLHHYSPEHIVEIGCGSELQSAAYRSQGGRRRSWTIVEPSSEFATIARNRGFDDVSVINAHFEEAVPQIECLPTPSVIICSGLLHEVSDQRALLKAIVSVMGTKTVLHGNVPNAHSLHRRLGVAMKVSKTVFDPSHRNELLQQPRVYDLELLEKDLSAARLRIVASGGYFMKPFSHDQMSRIEDVLGWELLDGLDALGREHPEWSSEIYFEAVIE